MEQLKQDLLAEHKRIQEKIEELDKKYHLWEIDSDEYNERTTHLYGQLEGLNYAIGIINQMKGDF